MPEVAATESTNASPNRATEHRGTRVHAFIDDALGTDDAVALAARVRSGEVSPEELVAAAITRADKVDGELHAVATPMYERPRTGARPTGALYGVPTFLKDNRDLVGQPTNHGSEAFVARPAKVDAPFSSQYLSTGLTVIGKSRMPEFGLNASTEFMTGEPTRNPWNPAYSVGASSGGSAALVASGVVPIAHANDGGGSIRIPAAAAGLVGLKPSRGRHLVDEISRRLPIDLVSDGVVTRTVRDTAAFLAAIEDDWRNPALVPVGLVEGPAARRLRVGLLLETFSGPPDAETEAAVRRAAAALEAAGHVVDEVQVPVDRSFADDFLRYWGFLAELLYDSAKAMLDRNFDATRADGLGLGLRAHHRRAMHRTPGAIRRLKAAARQYATMFDRHEVILSPVLRHTTPELGHLSPTVPFDVLQARLADYVAYTPIQNITGAPGMSLPLGRTADGRPVGVQLQGAFGDERTLLEVAFLLEAALPFARIEDED
jgi:amidase